MNGGHFVPMLASVVLVIAACSGSSDGSSQPIGNETVENRTSEQPDAGARSSESVSLVLEQRLGKGRAVAAASNGTEMLVATTVGLVVRSDDAPAFETVTPLVGAARAVAISPDGSRAAVVMADRRLAVWSTGDRPEQIVEVPDVVEAEFRRDGSLAVVSSDGVRVMNVADGSSIAEWVVPADRVMGPVALADDDRLIMALAGGPTPELAIWTADGDAARVPVPIDGDDGVIEAMVAGGGRLAVAVRAGAGGFDRSIAMIEVGDSDSLWTVELGSDAASETWSLGADGGIVIGEAARVRVIDGEGATAASVTTAVPVTRVSRGGFVGLVDGSLLRIDASGEASEIRGALDPLTDVDVDRATGAATYVDAAGRIGFVEEGSLTSVSTDEFVAGSINDVSVAPDGRVATASANGVVEVRGTAADATGEEPVRLVHDEGNVDSVAFSVDGGQLATGIAQRRAATAFDDTVSLWPSGGSERIFEIGGEAEDVAGCSFFTNRLRFARDGTFVVSTSHDFTVSVIAIPSGELLHSFPPHVNSVLDVAISPDDSLLITSGDDSTMRVWDLATFELVADHPVTMGGFWSMSFLPDGTSIVAGDLSGNLSIVDVATGETTASFSGNKDRSARTAISPDGELVAAGAEGSTVRLWSTVTGQVVDQVEGHSAPVSAVAFFEDGQRLVSASRDGTAIVWGLAG